MREVDRRTIELGIAGPILMENAGHRVVEFLNENFSPLPQQRIVVLCGKGNNGGDGYVIGRQLWTRFRPESLHVVAVLSEDESEPRRMLAATGCPVHDSVTPEMRSATLVVDAVLGTGIAGAARGRALEAIREINNGFPLARVVAVDVPSGMNTDSGVSEGEVARADATVTFTAPKICHVLAPNCDRMGELRVAHIGSAASLMENVRLHLSGPSYFRHLFAPRKPDSNKGGYGHVLVVGGSEGKSGAAEMAGLGALRGGAGLVTVASAARRLDTLELMTEPLPSSFEALRAVAANRNVMAIGPGLGTSPEAAAMVRAAAVESEQAVVIDADGLNVLAGQEWHGRGVRVLTPHPGEMSRLANCSTADVQSNRVQIAQDYALAHGCILVLKGHRTVIALPDGRTWINPTGSPAMSTGGTGDILTGLIAGTLAQSLDDPAAAVIAAVWLHGRAGELGARELGERCLIATDLLSFLPEAMRECENVPDSL
jgi:NAD(P)H-hydrate epimerase